MTETKPEYEVSQETWDKVEDVCFEVENYVEQVGFTQMSHLLTICPVSDGAYRTYALIRGLAQQGESIWWGLDKLATLRGIGTRTLRTHLREMIDLGLIIRHRRFGTSTVTYFPALERIFPKFLAQCGSAALWGRVEGDTDLKGLVQQVAQAFSEQAESGLFVSDEQAENSPTNRPKTAYKEEESKKKKLRDDDEGQLDIIQNTGTTEQGPFPHSEKSSPETNDPPAQVDISDISSAAEQFRALGVLAYEEAGTLDDTGAGLAWLKQNPDGAGYLLGELRKGRVPIEMGKTTQYAEEEGWDD